MRRTEYPNPKNKLFQKITQLREKYLEKGLNPFIFDTSFNLASEKNIISLYIDIKKSQPLNLLGLSCVIDVLKKKGGYEELEFFSKSIKGTRSLQEFYSNPQPKLGTHADCQIKDQEELRKFRECFMEVVEAIYVYLKESIIIVDDIEAKVALLIANDFKIEEISTLLREKKITTEELHPESLKILKIFKYNIKEALSSIKKNINVLLQDILSKLPPEILSSALIERTKLEDIELVKILLDIKGIDPNTQDEDGLTALHLAILKENLEEKDLEIAQAILDHKDTNPNIRDSYGNTPLHLIILKENLKEKDLEIVQAILDHKDTNPNIRDSYGSVPLHLVILKENLGETDLKIVEALLANGLKLTDEDVYKLLYLAATHGHLDLIEELLAKFTDKDVYTILYLATRHEHLELIEALLEKLTDEDVYKPLYEAVLQGHSKLVRTLLDYGVDPNKANNNGKTPLELVISKRTLKQKDLETLEALLAKGANLKDADVLKLTDPALLDKILDNAFKNGYSELVKTLLAKGVNPNTQDKDGYTLLHESVIRKNIALTEVLLKYGADPNRQNNDGNTPLQLLVFLKRNLKKEDLEIVNLLLAHGAKADIKNYNGKTALDLATANGYSEIVEAFDHYAVDPNKKNERGNTLLQPKINMSVAQSVASPGKNGETSTSHYASQDQSQGRNSEVVAFTLVTLGIVCIITELFLATKTNKLPIDFTQWIDPKIIAFNIIAILLPFSLLVAGTAIALAQPTTKVDQIVHQDISDNQNMPSIVAY